MKGVVTNCGKDPALEVPVYSEEVPTGLRGEGKAQTRTTSVSPNLFLTPKGFSEETGTSSARRSLIRTNRSGLASQARFSVNDLERQDPYALSLFRLLPASPAAVSARLLLRGPVRACWNWPSRWPSRRSWTGCCPSQNWGLILGATAGLLGDLLAQHRPAVHRQLLGARPRHLHRDRDAAQDLRPPAEALVPVLRQPEDGPPGRPRDQRPGRRRRGGAPRAGRCVYRRDDVSRLVRADVHAERQAGADHRAGRPADDVDLDPLRPGDDADHADPVRAGGGLQRPDRGERRRHPRRAGVRQRGPRAGAVRARTTPATGRPSWTPTG